MSASRSRTREEVEFPAEREKRFGWAAAAEAMRARGEDRLLDKHTPTRFEDESWQWY